MIKRLKKQYIILNMLIMNVMLICMLSYIYLATTHSMEEIGDRILHTKLNEYTSNRELVVRTNYTYAVISMNDKGEPFFVANTSVLTNQDLKAVTSEILEQNNSIGTLENNRFRYMVSHTATPIALAVIDNSFQYETLYKLQLRLLGIWLVVNFVFILISYRLSLYITKPILKSWEQQKQFLSDASHELKTPLTVLLTNTSILQKKHSKDPDTLKWLVNMDHENKRMRYLVDELLFLAKSDEGRDQHFMTEISFSDILDRSVLVFEAYAYEKGVMLKTDIEEKITLTCLPDQIKQLVSILIDNAIKYAIRGEIVTVTLHRVEHKTIFTVRNNLTLIDSKDLPKIFDRFYRADTGRSNKETNYGLGLSIAKKIVDTHEASIHAVSIKEIGTVFTVKF